MPVKVLLGWGAPPSPLSRMRLMKKVILACLMSLTVSQTILAGPFGRWRGQASQQNAQTGQSQTYQTRSGGFATAAAAAAYMASIGRIGHFGGNPYPAEGVGMGMTADQAIRNCCFYGRRQIADQGVSQGANGRWYACNRYW